MMGYVTLRCGCAINIEIALLLDTRELDHFFNLDGVRHFEERLFVAGNIILGGIQ
jgi:hypothetical protein